MVRRLVVFTKVTGILHDVFKFVRFSFCCHCIILLPLYSETDAQHYQPLGSQPKVVKLYKYIKLRQTRNALLQRGHTRTLNRLQFRFLGTKFRKLFKSSRDNVNLKVFFLYPRKGKVTTFSCDSNFF